MPTSAPIKFDRSAVGSLAERTEYESCLLEAVYTIVEDELFAKSPDAMIYPANGSSPQLFGFARTNITLGHWREGFLSAGAPLIFVSTFKLVDMLVEWVLERNLIASTFRFQDKIKALGGTLTLPPFLSARPWLVERLLALYAALEPLRGTIIHSRNFKTNDGAIHVSSTKGKTTGPEIVIGPEQLRALAVTVLSVLRYVNGSWKCDEYREKLLRHDLDKIANLHGKSLLSQRRPYFPTVRVFLVDKKPTAVDVSVILADLARSYPNDDCMFDLRTLIVMHGDVVEAFLFPWKILKKGGRNWGTRIKAERYSIPVPVDVNSEHCAGNAIEQPVGKRSLPSPSSPRSSTAAHCER